MANKTKMAKVSPDFLAQCNEGLALLADISVNAPFGIGMLFISIKSFLDRIQTTQDNKHVSANMIKDLNTLISIINQICSIPENPRNRNITLSISNLKDDIDEATRAIGRPEDVSCFAMFIMANSQKGHLDKVSKNLAQSKITLNLALTASLKNDPCHIIPGSTSGTRSCCDSLTNASDPPNQCMIQKKSTGVRCTNGVPKYKLVSKKGTDSMKVVYYSCGHCSPDKKGAWWRNDYVRVKRG